MRGGYLLPSKAGVCSVSAQLSFRIKITSHDHARAPEPWPYSRKRDLAPTAQLQDPDSGKPETDTIRARTHGQSLTWSGDLPCFMALLRCVGWHSMDLAPRIMGSAPHAPHDKQCMCTCIFYTVHVGSDMEQELTPGTAGITDEAVTESAPMVRALVVSRLELIWRACEPHIMPPPPLPGELPRRPDPRFVEAGIRVNDRLMSLYGLLKPAMGQEKGELTSSEEVEAALARVKELEARMRPADEPRSHPQGPAAP